MVLREVVVGRGSCGLVRLLGVDVFYPGEAEEILRFYRVGGQVRVCRALGGVFLSKTVEKEVRGKKIFFVCKLSRRGLIRIEDSKADVQVEFVGELPLAWASSRAVKEDWIIFTSELAQVFRKLGLGGIEHEFGIKKAGQESIYLFRAKSQWMRKEDYLQVRNAAFLKAYELI